MYTQIWSKYLPIIKILLKRSANGNQTLELNRIDFERAGTGRKAGYKFLIEFVSGRTINVLSGIPLAKDLADTMLADVAIKEILLKGNYEVALNTRFQLSIKNVTPAATIEEV
jgi:hypothetical protein